MHCHVVNLQTYLGGAEVYTLFFTRALLDLGIDVTLHAHPQASHWNTLQHDALRIVHHCAPIEAAFGSGSRAWSPAVLEGAYEQWLRAAGAGDRLRVQQIATETASAEPVYVFALAA